MGKKADYLAVLSAFLNNWKSAKFIIKKEMDVLRGRYLLLCTGVLFVILGSAISIPMIITGITGGVGGHIIFPLLYGMFSLVTGVLGIVFSNNFYKAKILMLLGVIHICLFTLTNLTRLLLAPTLVKILL